MKTFLLSAFVLLSGISAAIASSNDNKPDFSAQQREITDLSRTKWQWMSECKVDSLDKLFHDRSVFVHIGGAMDKDQELDVIRNGGIHYKKADIFEESVRFAGKTAILLGRIKLLAVVGGREVVNPFMVTEVYVRENDIWKLASLSFTRLLEPEFEKEK